MKRTAAAFEDYLQSNGHLDKDKIDRVRSEREVSKCTFKQACLKLGFLTEENYAVAEAGFLEIPFMNLEDYLVESETLKILPMNIIKGNGVFPLFKIDNTLTIATHNPYNIIALDQIRGITKLNVEMVLATEKDIQDAIKRYMGGVGISDSVKTLAEDVLEEEGAEGAEGVKGAGAEGQDAPIVKLVNQTIVQAVEDKASDIHMEPEEGFVRLRFRIDGVLTEITQIPKKIQNAVISRIKIMSKLDIAESRKPQDGKIRLKLNNREIDIRVSTFPTAYGENVVMRLLERANISFDLKQLGFSDRILSEFKKLLTKPYGIILVTGPTGAGKTTTLYAGLSAINSVDRNIMTVEDPIEYQLPMIRQSQVNPKAGMTFAAGLRAILRQDPDVILVGEIRDTETAQIAVECALTGHLVFSTLHTNDAPGAVSRLLDMGIEPFLISSATVAVVAQRLLRLICENCKKELDPREAGLGAREIEIIEEIWAKTTHKKDAKPKVFRGKGCSACKHSGYKGRVAIYELMVVTNEIRDAILRRAPTGELRKISFVGENLSLLQDGFLKVLQGLTTVEEVMRVSKED